MTGTLPPETFRVHPWPERARGHVVVHVATTLDEMKAGMVATGVTPAADQLACAVGASGREQHARLVAIVFLAKERLSVDLVAHEMGHVAFRVIEQSGLGKVRHWEHQALNPQHSEVHASEETYCDVLERLIGEFWTNFGASGGASS